MEDWRHKRNNDWPVAQTRRFLARLRSADPEGAYTPAKTRCGACVTHVRYHLATPALWYTARKARLGWVMSNWQPTRYKDYEWIVADPQLLGGKLAIRGTRLSVSLILECLAAGMSLEEIDEAFDRAFPHEALLEVLKVAAELANSVHVAA